jgi:hypothetical protein
MSVLEEFVKRSKQIDTLAQAVDLLNKRVTALEARLKNGQPTKPDLCHQAKAAVQPRQKQLNLIGGNLMTGDLRVLELCDGKTYPQLAIAMGVRLEATFVPVRRLRAAGLVETKKRHAIRRLDLPGRFPVYAKPKPKKATRAQLNKWRDPLIEALVSTSGPVSATALARPIGCATYVAKVILDELIENGLAVVSKSGKGVPNYSAA